MNAFLKQVFGFVVYPFLLYIGILFFHISFMEASLISDKIVAKVNDTIITESQLANKIHWMKKQMTSKQIANFPTEASLREQMLQHIINLEVQNQAVEKAGIIVKDILLDHMIQESLEQNNQTLETLQNELRAKGLPYALYREQLRQEIASNLLQQQMGLSDITVSSQEVRDQSLQLSSSESQDISVYYRVEDLLIPLNIQNASKKAIKSAHQKAIDILKEAQQGRSFRELIANHKATDWQINDLGLRKLEALPEIFSEPLATLKAGQIAGPIQAPNGFHLIYLKEIVRGNINPNIVEDSDPSNHQRIQQAAQLVYQRKLLESKAEWLHGLRAKTYIKVYKYDNSTEPSKSPPSPARLSS